MLGDSAVTSVIIEMLSRYHPINAQNAQSQSALVLFSFIFLVQQGEKCFGRLVTSNLIAKDRLRW